MPPVQNPTTQVVDIPLSIILPNPENPAGPVAPAEARAMADSLGEVGQKTEIRVRHLTEAEKAQHPGFEYLLIGGHVRLEGAKLAGLPSLRAIVVGGSTPDQEFLDAVLDNRWRDMGWWKWDLAIEKLLKVDRNLQQKQLAAQLGWSVAKINRAWKVTQALTPTARELVGQNLDTRPRDEGDAITPRNQKNKGFLITESILLALAELAPLRQGSEGQGDLQIVENALRRVVDDQMTESQARGLVLWLKAGGLLEDYGVIPPVKKGSGGVLASTGPAPALGLPTDPYPPIGHQPAYSNPKRPPNPIESAH